MKTCEGLRPPHPQINKPSYGRPGAPGPPAIYPSNPQNPQKHFQRHRNCVLFAERHLNANAISTSPQKFALPPASSDFSTEAPREKFPPLPGLSFPPGKISFKCYTSLAFVKPRRLTIPPTTTNLT